MWLQVPILNGAACDQVDDSDNAILLCSDFSCVVESFDRTLCSQGGPKMDSSLKEVTLGCDTLPLPMLFSWGTDFRTSKMVAT